MIRCNSSIPILVQLLCWALGICNGNAFSQTSWKGTRRSNYSNNLRRKPLAALSNHDHGSGGAELERSDFIKHATNKLLFGTTIARTIVVSPMLASISIASPSNAIEFVPPSPFFRNTYSDALQIMYSQRIALDNIANVIADGNIEEAGFKIMQLIAQTRTAGKIILDTFQGELPKKDAGVVLLRFLSCQKKFAILLDLCDDCGDYLQRVMKEGKGAAANNGNAAAQIKTLSIVEETKSAYDDFLADLKMLEKELESTK